jgi:hypothetical protein
MSSHFRRPVALISVLSLLAGTSPGTSAFAGPSPWKSANAAFQRNALIPERFLGFSTKLLLQVPRFGWIQHGPFPQNHTLATTREYQQKPGEPVGLLPHDEVRARHLAAHQFLRQHMAGDELFLRLLQTLEFSIVRGLGALGTFFPGKRVQIDQLAMGHAVSASLVTAHEIWHAKLFHWRGPPADEERAAEEIAVTYKELEMLFQVFPQQLESYETYLRENTDAIHSHGYMDLIARARTEIWGPAQTGEQRATILRMIGQYLEVQGPTLTRSTELLKILDSKTDTRTVMQKVKANMRALGANAQSYEVMPLQEPHADFPKKLEQALERLDGWLALLENGQPSHLVHSRDLSREILDPLQQWLRQRADLADTHPRETQRWDAALEKRVRLLDAKIEAERAQIEHGHHGYTTELLRLQDFHMALRHPAAWTFWEAAKVIELAPISQEALDSPAGTIFYRNERARLFEEGRPAQADDGGARYLLDRLEDIFKPELAAAAAEARFVGARLTTPREILEQIVGQGQPVALEAVNHFLATSRSEGPIAQLRGRVLAGAATQIRERIDQVLDSAWKHLARVRRSALKLNDSREPVPMDAVGLASFGRRTLQDRLRALEENVVDGKMLNSETGDLSWGPETTAEIRRLLGDSAKNFNVDALRIRLGFSAIQVDQDGRATLPEFLSPSERVTVLLGQEEKNKGFQFWLDDEHPQFEFVAGRRRYQVSVSGNELRVESVGMDNPREPVQRRHLSLDDSRVVTFGSNAENRLAVPTDLLLAGRHASFEVRRVGHEHRGGGHSGMSAWPNVRYEILFQAEHPTLVEAPAPPFLAPAGQDLVVLRLSDGQPSTTAPFTGHLWISVNDRIYHVWKEGTSYEFRQIYPRTSSSSVTPHHLLPGRDHTIRSNYNPSGRSPDSREDFTLRLDRHPDGKEFFTIKNLRITTYRWQMLQALFAAPKAAEAAAQSNLPRRTGVPIQLQARIGLGGVPELQGVFEGAIDIDAGWQDNMDVRVEGSQAIVTNYYSDLKTAVKESKTFALDTDITIGKGAGNDIQISAKDFEDTRAVLRISRSAEGRLTFTLKDRSVVGGRIGATTNVEWFVPAGTPSPFGVTRADLSDGHLLIAQAALAEAGARLFKEIQDETVMAHHASEIQLFVARHQDLEDRLDATPWTGYNQSVYDDVLKLREEVESYRFLPPRPSSPELQQKLREAELLIDDPDLRSAVSELLQVYAEEPDEQKQIRQAHVRFSTDLRSKLADITNRSEQASRHPSDSGWFKSQRETEAALSRFVSAVKERIISIRNRIEFEKVHRAQARKGKGGADQSSAFKDFFGAGQEGSTRYAPSDQVTEAKHFATLGMSRTADWPTIRRKYRKLSRELHADRNPGDKVAEEKHKAVNKAAAYLRDRYEIIHELPDHLRPPERMRWVTELRYAPRNFIGLLLAWLEPAARSSDVENTLERVQGFAEEFLGRHVTLRLAVAPKNAGSGRYQSRLKSGELDVLPRGQYGRWDSQAHTLTLRIDVSARLLLWAGMHELTHAVLPGAPESIVVQTAARAMNPGASSPSINSHWAAALHAHFRPLLRARHPATLRALISAA